MEVGGFPGIHGEAEGGETRLVISEGQCVGAAHGGECGGEAREGADLFDAEVGGGIEVGGHLEGERAAGGEEGGVVLEPVECGVGDEDVEGAWRLPASEVGHGEVDVRGRGALEGLGDHGLGGVNAVDEGEGPTFREGEGEIAGAAAEIGDEAGLWGVDASEELEEGA
jgi:hypothetical protein